MIGKLRSVSIAAIVFGCALPAVADSLTINFDSYATGNLPGSGVSDTRTPGGPNWYYPSNAATSAKVVNVGGGNNALKVYNNGNGNDGVITNVLSPQLNQLAGETGPGVQAGAQASTFKSSFTFSTVSGAPVTGFDFKSESWGQDRTTWLEFHNVGGNLVANYSGVTSGSTPNSDVFNNNAGTYAGALTSLDWSHTYRVDTTVNFVNGSSNDVVNVNVFDVTANAAVWSATDTTWEQYYRLDSEQIPNGNIVTGVNAIAFQMRGSTPGEANGVLIDNVSIAAVPLPSSAWMGLALIAGMGLMRARKVRQAI